MGYLRRYPMRMWLCIISGSHLIYENVVIQCKLDKVHDINKGSLW
jgi:hypothetical protein